MHKRIVSIIFCGLLLFGMVAITGCAPKQDSVEKQEIVQEPAEEEPDEKADEETKVDSDKEDEDDNVIIAGTIDTSSKFSFKVEEAIAGISYSFEPIVVLVGSFENNSDEEISFNWALDVTATQNGYTLQPHSLSGSHSYNYNDIAPGKKISVFIGWKLADIDSDVTLTVIDKQHYAKVEIYSRTFTIDELLEYADESDEADEILGESL